MNRILILLLVLSFSSNSNHAQDFGDLPKIKKDALLNYLELLYQGLDKFHTGMYWYTPKDSVDLAFDEVRRSISSDLNVMQFHKRIAPLVALSREDHTNIYLSSDIKQQYNKEAKYLPLIVVFLGKNLYCAI